MKNRGQTTVFFSLMVSVLLIFTLTALEAERIYVGHVKEKAVIYSARTSVLADYHRELFERYHLLFYDPTYGTGSEAVAEEKITSYIEESLNGGSTKLYRFQTEEIALVGTKRILDNDMRLLKNQILEYEKSAGLLDKAEDALRAVKDGEAGVETAEQETERNAKELPNMQEDTADETTGQVAEETEDPRKTLQELLQQGLLAVVLPDQETVSDQPVDFSDAPSAVYTEVTTDDSDEITFQDIAGMKGRLKNGTGIWKQATADRLAFGDYVNAHFSNMVHPKEETVLKCETEYILAGKDNDADNLQTVMQEIAWLRMPVNYAYLLTDTAKKSEALTVAAGICTAAGTPGLIEVVKYLLLGCWSYGESVYELRLLMSGESIPYVKRADTWYTDLKTLAASNAERKQTGGMDYEKFLFLLLVKKANREISYARMLDLVEKNLQREMPTFRIRDLVGAGTIQGKISVNPLFRDADGGDAYTYYFETTFSYTED